MTTPRYFSAIAGAAALSLVSSAAAQSFVDTRYSSHFFFGDSLSDTGNLFAATGGTQPPSPPYFNGRFSNGPVFPEILVPGLANATTAAPTVRGNLNFAFGGATAQSDVTNPPNFGAQIGLFNQRQLSIASNDLVSVLFGANDFFNKVSIATNQNTTAINGIATASATAVSTGINTLIGRGGRNFLVFGLPDLGNTAQFLNSPARPLGSTYTDTFNSQLQTQLSTIRDSSGARFTFVDLRAFVNRLRERPADFGFTNVNNAFLPPLGTAQGDPNGFLFYDGVHPTNRAELLVVRMITEALNPEFALVSAAAPARASLAALDLVSDTTITRLDTIRSQNIIRESISRDAKGNVTGSERGTKFDLFGSYTYLDAERVGDFGSLGTNFRMNVGQAGGDVQLANGLSIGGIVSIGDVRGGVSNGGSYKMDFTTVNAYAQYRPGPYFVDLSFGGGTFDVNRIRRPTLVPTVFGLGQTSASAQYGHFRVGYEFRAGQGFVFGPVVGYRYLRTTLSGWNETDAAGLDFSFGRQTISSHQGTFGLFGLFQGKLGRMDASARFSATYRHDFQDGSRNVSGKLNNILNSTTVLSTYDGNGRSIDLNAGFSAMISRRLGLHVDYQASVREDDKLANRVTGTLSYSF
ncbi:MAG: autotransporter domain-containing protein [Verrucomicrobia bacterium]|nr:autotransporter domain-containing protein [Verrucomicrobiota bacterium]